jgi:uncharacterized membrane protein
MLHCTRRVTGAILWANLHLLFWLSLVPFVTAWMGENPLASTPTALYGVVLLMAGLAYGVLQRQILRSEGPQSVLADALYLLVVLMWLIPDRRIERALAQAAGRNDLPGTA